MELLKTLDAILQHFNGAITSFVIVCLFLVVLVYLKRIGTSKTTTKSIVAPSSQKASCKTDIKSDLVDLKVSLTNIQEDFKKDILCELRSGDKEILGKLVDLTKRVEALEDTNHKEHSEVVDLLHEVTRLAKDLIFEQMQVLKDMAIQLDRLTDALD